MANPLKGEAAVEVEGVRYALAFDINAMCEVEYILALSTDQILRALAHRPPLHVVRALLWGGLRRHHAGIDLPGAGDLIEKMGGPGPALEGIGQALQSAFPEPEAGDPAARPRKGAPAGTGRRSSKPG